MRICGIDPGLRNTGWGIIATDGNRLTHIADGIIRPPTSASTAIRLGSIHHELTAVLKAHHPQKAAIEEVFVAHNPASALKLGMARGVAMIALNDYHLPIDEISARSVKKNVTGSGRADKAQVLAWVQRLLGVTPKGVDSADALAVALAVALPQAVGLPPSPHTGEKSALGTAIAKALAQEQV